MLDFYEENSIDLAKPKLFNPQQDQQLLVVCHPSELIIELLFVLSKIVNELN